MNDLQSALLAMLKMQVLVNPGDGMILESPLDDLVQKIGREKFVDVGTGKASGKWLYVENFRSQLKNTRK